MASGKSIKGNSSELTDKSAKGAREGILYEAIILAVVAKNGYELSKRPDSKYHDFAICREADIGKDSKFDDVVFRYTENDDTKNFIFVQIKHKQEEQKIDSTALCAEASSSKGGGNRRDFNLQKYFISYLCIREELKNTTSKEFKNGKIKYIVIFTNSGFDTEELMSNGFILKEAPGDIQNLFTLNKSTQNCFQLSHISGVLSNLFNNSSDLKRVARELAQCAVWKEYRGDKIMGIDIPPIKHYHAALKRDVIQKSEQVEDKSSINQAEMDSSLTMQHDVSLDRAMVQEPIQVKNKSGKKKTQKNLYCKAKFRDDFLKNDKPGSKKQLRDAIFEAVRELDKCKSHLSDENIKEFLKEVEWKVVPAFGKTKHSKNLNLPSTVVEENDITDFLKCLVFVVNQPRVNELEGLFGSSLQDIILDTNCASLLKEILDKLEKAPAELKDILEKELRLSLKREFGETWIAGEQIVQILDDQKEQINLPFFVIALTLIYESKVMQLGEFTKLGEMERLHSFLSNNTKILCVETSHTLLSSLKILQFLKSNKNYTKEMGRIHVKMDHLRKKESRDIVRSAFGMDRFFLLVVECGHEVNRQEMIEYYKEIRELVKDKGHKKIIFIIYQDIHSVLFEEIKRDFPDKGQFLLISDTIDLRNFDPQEDPFKKQLVIFQEQEEMLSLASLTGIDSWSSYVDTLSQENGDQAMIDERTLVEILYSEEMKVGSKPLGTSSLDGAYANLFEKINVETLANKLTSQHSDNNKNDMYIISGICASSKEKEIDTLIQYLRLTRCERKFENILTDIDNEGKIQIVDNNFKNDDFQRYCGKYPEKRIFWVCAKYEDDARYFYLQKIYNPNFYLKRKFEKVIINKEIKELLIKKDLFDVFIFYSIEDEQMLCKFMELNEFEKKEFEENCAASKIKIFTLKTEAETAFKQYSEVHNIVHLLEFAGDQVLWCDSVGSVENLRKYIDHEQKLESLFEEDDLFTTIKNRKVVVFADDPGMGKTTTLVKLYEKEHNSSSIIKSNWVIEVKLRGNLEAVQDIELKKGGIDKMTVIKFLTKFDSNLSNNTAKFLLQISLDKSRNFSKPLLLAFDGFDEILDDDYRNRVISLLKFLRNETGAKLLISTRVQYKLKLEKELATFAVRFSPLSENQRKSYVTMYLHNCLYLCLNETMFDEFFTTCNQAQGKKSIQKYADEFLNKMKFCFRGNTSIFIGTPLQLFLMLDGCVTHVKQWIERHDKEITTFEHVGNNILEVYQNFTERKYNIYFCKLGLQQRSRREFEKILVDTYHKEIAESKTLGESINNYLEEEKDIFLFVGIIKSLGSDLEFIHNTFQEFFVAKVFIDWILNCPNTYKLECILKSILIQPDYQLVRKFMDLMLRKMEKLDIAVKRLKQYDKFIIRLLNEKENPLSNGNGTTLHVASTEGNKEIACLLLKLLEDHPHDLKKFLFIRNEREETALHVSCRSESVEIVRILLDASAGFAEDILHEFLFSQDKEGRTALHVSCRGNNVEIVRALLDVAANISEDTLQVFLYLNFKESNALTEAQTFSNNIEIAKELVRRAKCKLDLVLYPRNSFLSACEGGNEEFVTFLIQQFKHDKNSLKILLLRSNESGDNTLTYALKYSVITEMLISAAKSLSDKNETLEDLIFPYNNRPLVVAVEHRSIDAVKTLINIAKDLDDDNHTLKEMLMNSYNGKSALHAAVRKKMYINHVNTLPIINLLLETAADLGIEVLEELLFAVDECGRTFIDIMIQYGYDEISVDSFKLFAEDEYRHIRGKVIEMFENVPLPCRLAPYRLSLYYAIMGYNIEEVKQVLNEVKSSCAHPYESLKYLLTFPLEDGENSLYLACADGSSNIIQELLSCAISIDERGIILKQMLGPLIFSLFSEECKNKMIQIVEVFSSEAKNKSKEDIVNIFKDFLQALNLFTAIKDVDIVNVKSILSTAKSDGFLIDKNYFWGVMIKYACIKENSKIIQQIISYITNIEDEGETLRETLRVRPFEGLSEKRTNITLQVVETISKEAEKNNKQHVIDILEDFLLDLNKENLFTAIARHDIERVKRILNSAKSAVFILKVDPHGRNALHHACHIANSDIIKELIYYAMNIDDGGQTLTELLKMPNRWEEGPFDELGYGYTDEIKQTIEVLITEARNANKEQILNVLKEIDEEYTEKSHVLSVMWKKKIRECQAQNSTTTIEFVVKKSEN